MNQDSLCVTAEEEWTLLLNQESFCVTVEEVSGLHFQSAVLFPDVVEEVSGAKNK